MTPSIEVDTMWTQNKDTFAVSGSFAIVQGHPHRDERDSTTRPVTSEPRVAAPPMRARR
ncbi:MAG: hypothetical protein ACRDTG_16215 [Pseudonocardiaceae bacterium]